jgi:cyclohexanecarboxyl-CoA dehydrogenase
MDFDFTEEEKMWQRTVRDFAVKELRPHYVETTRTRVRHGQALPEELPRDLVKRMGDIGCFGIMIPEKYGGQPGNRVMLGIAHEEVCREYHDIGLLLSSNWAMMQGALIAAGGEEVREELIPPTVRGERICTFTITEPMAGSDVSQMKSTAIRDGDYYIVNGEKTSQCYGAQGDIAEIFLKTDPKAGFRGISGFVMPLNLPGITRANLYHIGGQEIGASSMIFDNVKVPVKYRIGEEGKGFLFAMQTVDWMRDALALMSLGCAEASLEDTINYVKDRNAFGQPVGKFEGVSFKIAEHLTFVEAARLLCYKALWLTDQGRLAEATTATAHAKWWAPRVATQAIWDCIVLHGHVGFSTEYLLGRRLLDSMCWQLGDGTQEVMKTILVRNIMGKDMVAYK